MTATQLLTTCRAAGIVLATDGDQLTYDAPVGQLTPELREALAANKGELLAVLSRLADMRRHGTQQTGDPGRPPVAMARWPHHGGPGVCFSCGDPHPEPTWYGRCLPCAVAAELYYRADDGIDGIEV